MFELSFNHIMKYMGTHLLFDDLNFQIFSGDRVGIVGPNGCGKSTILKLIAGIEPLNIYIGSWSVGYDKGVIQKPREATISYLDQIPNYPESYKVKDVLMASFEDALKLEGKMRKLEDEMSILEGEPLDIAMKKYAAISLEYETKGGYEIGEKYNRICVGLQFDDAFLNQFFSKLSGGEQTRVVLGKILLDKPDILLLDEPTNHLDTNAIEWLEAYLSTYPGILIIVSHDRYFLDQVVNKVIEIEDLQAQTFNGNYSSYVEQKEEQVRIQYEQYLEQKKQIQQMENQVKKLRDWAIRAENNKFFRRAASIQKRLEKMDRIKRPQLEKTNMAIDLTTQSRTGKETIRAEALCKSFGDKAIFKGADLLVQYGQRMAFIGPNGSGKTTFVKMLLGLLEPDGGMLKLAPSSKVAYLPQQISFNDESMTVVECFREDLDISEGKAREYLAKFMFFGKRVFTDVKALSGGERVRLKLAKLLYDEVNLLILDEPTNHLDIDSIETLEEALEAFNGTIFFISHDRYFINNLDAHIAAIEDCKIHLYPGNYDVYKNEREKMKSELIPSKPESVSESQTLKQVQSIEKNRKPNLVKIELLESEISSVECEIDSIDKRMIEMATDYEMLRELTDKKASMQKTLDDLMEKWLAYQ